MKHFHNALFATTLYIKFHFLKEAYYAYLDCCLHISSYHECKFGYTDSMSNFVNPTQNML